MIQYMVPCTILPLLVLESETLSSRKWQYFTKSYGLSKQVSTHCNTQSRYFGTNGDVMCARLNTFCHGKTLSIGFSFLWIDDYYTATETNCVIKTGKKEDSHIKVASACLMRFDRNYLLSDPIQSANNWIKSIQMILYHLMN